MIVQAQQAPQAQPSLSVRRLTALFGINRAWFYAARDTALACRQPAAGLVHHSNRGVQYASAAYIARRESVGARVSMSTVGNPYDNAKAERFFKTLKYEEVYLNDSQTFAEAEPNLDHFIEDVDNTKRLHASLGYRPPSEFEALHTLPSAEVS